MTKRREESRSAGLSAVADGYRQTPFLLYCRRRRLQTGKELSAAIMTEQSGYPKSMGGFELSNPTWESDQKNVDTPDPDPTVSVQNSSIGKWYI